MTQQSAWTRAVRPQFCAVACWQLSSLRLFSLWAFSFLFSFWSRTIPHALVVFVFTREAAWCGVRCAARRHFIREKFHHLAERDAAVAVQIFFFARNLRKCFAQRRKEENRIVSEPTGTLRFVEQQTAGLRGDDCARHSAVGEGDDADKVGAAGIPHLAAHGGEELGDAVGVGGVGTGVAGGVNA